MFGRGKIDIKLQRTNYTPGDTISGTVALALKKSMKARELSISLTGEYKSTQTTGPARVPSARRTLFVDARASMSYSIKHDYRRPEKKVRICNFQQQLDGENEYMPGREYPFEIKLSADIPTGPVKWYLLAKLDIPGGLDINKKVKLKIR
jgi:sporulation-control protein spo0M